MKVLRRCSQLAVLLALVFAVSAGTAMYQVRVSASELRTSFSDVLEHYSTNVPLLIRELSEVPDLSDDDRAQAARLLEGFSQLPKEANLQSDTKVLAEQLSGLRTFLIQIAANEHIASTETFAKLKALSYAQGDASSLVHAYNQRVLVWNQRDATFLGHLLSSTLRLEKLLMVNADGSTEFLPTIKL